MRPTPTWRFVVPVKGGAEAKTRLRLETCTSPTLHAALADAFARDTVAAVRAGMPDSPVVVVTADAHVAAWAGEDGCHVVTDPGQGLNAAVHAGLRTAWTDPSVGVAVLLGDHPALTADEVRALVRAGTAYRSCFVADAEGTGTAALLLRPGAPEAIHFGPGSARAHEAAGHHRLTVQAPGLRQDVDDAQGLQRATALGLGSHTQALLTTAADR